MDALKYVSPTQVTKLPSLMATSHIDLTENYVAECRYLTSASTLGWSYVLWDERYACWVLEFLEDSELVCGRSANHHSLDPVGSCHPVRMDFSLER